MIREQTGKGLSAGTHEVFRCNPGVGLTTGTDDTVEKVVAHEAVVGDAVECIGFHAVVSIQVVVGQTQVPTAAHVDAHTQVAVDDA